MKKAVLVCLFILPVFILSAQVKLSVYSDIAIVTAGPGTKLYEKFGHSAIRITDPVLKLDIVYNYGIFDFNKPNFYTDFAQGKMYYLLARYNFKHFLNSYKKEKRWVKQQTLNLTIAEKQALFIVLENNAQPKNATYLYDPFFNNCATKPYAIIANAIKNPITIQAKKNTKTLRHLLQEQLYWNSWGSFGIHLITGSILDKTSTILSHNYLPDYLYTNLKNATISKNGNIENLVKKETVLADFKEQKAPFTIYNPLIVSILFILIIVIITIKDSKQHKRTILLDTIIFSITGFIGLCLVYFWLCSTHKTAPDNYNVLWAFLPNIIVAFKKLNTKKWAFYYIILLLTALVITVILWSFKVQLFSPILALILFALAFRYVYLAYYFNKKHINN